MHAHAHTPPPSRCSPLEQRVTDQPGLARAYRGQLKQDVQAAFSHAASAMEELYPAKLSTGELSAHTRVLQQLYRTIMLEMKAAERVGDLWVNNVWRSRTQLSLQLRPWLRQSVV